MITKEEFNKTMKDWNYGYAWEHDFINFNLRLTGEDVVNFLEKNDYTTHVFLAKVETVSRTYNSGGGTESEQYGEGYAKKLIAVKKGKPFPKEGTEHPSIFDTFNKLMKKKLLNL